MVELLRVGLAWSGYDATVRFFITLLLETPVRARQGRRGLVRR